MPLQIEHIKTLCEGRNALDLARAALCAGQVEAPGIVVDEHVTRIRKLAERALVAAPDRARTGDLLFALNTLLFDELGFGLAGKPEPHACLLDRVIDKQRGRPVALGVLYLSVGRSMGLELKGIPFPGRLLVAVGDGEALIVDPASGGSLLSRDDLELMLLDSLGPEKASAAALEKYLEGSSDRHVMARFLIELERAYARTGAPGKALEISECLLTVSPRRAAVHRERARLLERFDCPRAAREDYRRYLELAPNAADGEAIARRMMRLGRNGAILH